METIGYIRKEKSCIVLTRLDLLCGNITLNQLDSSSCKCHEFDAGAGIENYLCFRVLFFVNLFTAVIFAIFEFGGVGFFVIEA
jgi:hypothetical protein